MPGSRYRAESVASSTCPHALQPVLSSDSNPSWAGEGRARSPTRFGHVHRDNHRDSGSRRPPSPLRTAGSIDSGSSGERTLDISVPSARIAYAPVADSSERSAELTSHSKRDPTCTAAHQSPGPNAPSVDVGAVLANDTSGLSTTGSVCGTFGAAITSSTSQSFFRVIV